MHRKRTRASTSRAARRATAGLAALALASTSFALTSPTFATATVEVPRTSGADRYATSAAVSAATFTGTSTNVVLASGTDFPDGLSAAPLAGQLDAPVLLVPATGTLPTAIKTEITRLGATKGFIIGGTAAISADMEAQLKTAGLATMTRYAGADRYSTSKAVTGALTSIGTDNTKLTAFVATGGSFADALAASGPAFAAKMPLILTNSFSLNANAKNALTEEAIKKVIVVGGVNAISAGIVTEMEGMGIEVVRLSGATRNDTAAAIAGYVAGDADYGFTKTGVVLTKGTAFADALSAGPHAGKAKHPVLFVESTVPAATSAYLTANASTIATARLVGGVSAIPESVVSTVKTAAGGTTVVAGAYTVTATDEVVNSVTGSRVYTVSGLTAGTSVRIILATPAMVDAGAFAITTDNRDALLTNAANVGITEINGVAAGGAAVTTQTFVPSSSTMTFKVKATAATEVVPVVYAGDASDLTLQVNLAGAAREPAGIGGKVTFQAAVTAATPPAETANAAAVAAGAVSEIYTTGFKIGAVAAELVTRDHDIYKLNGGVVTKAQFMSVLSMTDVVAAIASYVNPSTAANPNTFNITTDNMATPANLNPTAVASTSTPGKVTVTYGTGTNGTLSSTTYDLQRQQIVSAGVPVVGPAGVWTTVNSKKVAAAGVQTFTETLASGMYSYRVRAVAPGFSGTATVVSAAVSDVTVTTATAPLAAPAVRRLYLTSNAGNINSLSSGDVVKIALTQPLTTPALGATVTLDGQTITYTAASSTAAGSATFSVNTAAEVVEGVSLAAGTVLTITMLEDPAAAAPFPGDLTTSSGIGNTAGALPDQAAVDTRVLARDVTS